MAEKHAMLSASASHRWMQCTPSAMLESRLPEQTSSFAEEGTEAHGMAESRLDYYLRHGKMMKRYKKCEDENAEMWETVGEYVDICIEKINKARASCKDATINIEQRLDFSPWVPEGFGTGDCVIIADDMLEVIDLKYGKGVEVSAHGNTQMMLYALGALNEFGILYSFSKIQMTIVQPRINNISSEIIDVDELKEWGEKIKPIAQKAFKGEGEKTAGEHCRFCKCRATCRTRAEYMTESIKEDFAASDLTDDEIAGIILKAQAIKRWLEDVESYALAKALDGQSWPGLKLVEGRSNRKITDITGAAKALSEAGYDDIFKPQELKSITELEKLTGKKRFAEIMNGYIEKPRGKATLVSESDKRPAMEIESIKDLFTDDFD
ncbi:MAG: DUF2800 domain-containing protein [Schwartzia sp.]|nr:DUF2800 domain-containing protein [Schwartzia sp. (in: firmicutes)]